MVEALVRATFIGAAAYALLKALLQGLSACGVTGGGATAVSLEARCAGVYAQLFLYSIRTLVIIITVNRYSVN